MNITIYVAPLIFKISVANLPRHQYVMTIRHDTFTGRDADANYLAK